jgi:DNA-binding NarL/FixJ family response regulator
VERANDVVEKVIAYLRDKVSVSLVGMYGSGRSTVIDQVAEQMAQAGATVVRVSGVLTLQDRPLGALAACGLDLTPTNTPNAIATATQAMVRTLSGSAPLLVVDDADFLDKTSVGVMIAAYLQTRCPMLVVSRPGRGSRDAMETFNAQVQPIVRVLLRPLHFDELHHLIHELLDGTVESNTVARVATGTGGLPALVRAVVWTAVRNGRISRVNGEWKAGKTLYSESLAEVVSKFLVDVSAEDLDALTKLALSGATKAADAVELIGSESFTYLDEAGLLQVIGSESDPLVGIFPPMLAEYLRTETSISRRLQINSEIGSSLPIRLVGHHDTSFSIYNSAILSTRIREHWLAEAELLRARWEADPVAENAVPLLMAMHSASVGPEEIFEVVAATDTSRSDKLWRLRLVLWQAVYRAVAMKELPVALKLLDSKRKPLPSFKTTLDSVKAHLVFMEDRVPDYESLVVKANDPAFGKDIHNGVVVECLLAQGRVDDALALMGTYDPDYPTYAHHAEIYRSLALLFADRVEEGIEYASAQLQRAQDALEPGLIHSFGYVTCFGLSLMGRFHEVDSIAASILTMTGVTTLYEMFQRGLLTLAALAASWDGRTTYARTLADQAGVFDKLGPFPAMLSGVAPAMVYRNDAEAADQLWAAADNRLERGYVMAAVLAAAAAVEHRPDAERAEQFYQAAQQTQSRLVRALGSYVLAASRMEAGELRSALGELKSTGTAVHILRAGVRLAVVLREQGDFSAAADAADDAWRSVEAPVRVRQSMFVPLSSMIDLSARELEIAQLITQGLVPSDVALGLSLSVRTVENHISNIYRKLGVSSRLRLRQIMNTWLSGLDARA